MSLEEIIKIDGVSYVYQGHDESSVVAVNDVSLNVCKGEFVCILGHNGSGKSTLARHINVLLRPTQGAVWVKGMSTAEDDNVWNIRQTAGMIFQNPDNQIVSAVVEDDVAFAAENLGVPSEEIRQRVNQALNDVRLGKYKDKSPAYLSGGQKQRLAIAGILAMDPEIIVLDEATAMLDPQGRKEIMSIIHKLNKEEQMTIVHITHYMEEAVEADKVFVMKNGQVIGQGTPEDIFSQKEILKEAELELPDIVRVADELRQEGVDISHNVLTVEGLVDTLCQ